MRLALAAAVLFAADLWIALRLPAPVIEAGTAVLLDVPDLARNSELIVEARVLSARPVEPPGELLQTEYLLEVSRTLAGMHEPYRLVRLPGGVREDQSGLLIPGLPRLEEGEEVLLFLTVESRNGMRMPVGLGQGKFGVQRLANGEKRLVRDTGSTELLGSGGTGVRRGQRSVLDYAGVLAEIEVGLADGRSSR